MATVLDALRLFEFGGVPEWLRHLAQKNTTTQEEGLRRRLTIEEERLNKRLTTKEERLQRHLTTQSGSGIPGAADRPKAELAAHLDRGAAPSFYARQPPGGRGDGRLPVPRGKQSRPPFAEGLQRRLITEEERLQRHLTAEEERLKRRMTTREERLQRRLTMESGHRVFSAEEAVRPRYAMSYAAAHMEGAERDARQAAPAPRDNSISAEGNCQLPFTLPRETAERWGDSSFDDIIRHIERRLGEAIACSAEGI